MKHTGVERAVAVVVHSGWGSACVKAPHGPSNG